MQWVWDHSETRGTDRLVLLVIAWHVHPETGECRPGNRTIARQANIAVSTASRSIARLVERGDLVIVRPGKGHGAASYVLSRPVENVPGDRSSDPPRGIATNGVSDPPRRIAGDSLAIHSGPLAIHSDPLAIRLGGTNRDRDRKDREENRERWACGHIRLRGYDACPTCDPESVPER